VARRVGRTELPPEPEWVTLAEAAQRLGMSKAWLGALAKSEGTHVVRRGRRLGVDWTTVETYIASSRVTFVDESLRRETRRPVRGLPLLERVGSRFGWSDSQLAGALGVGLSELSRYRRSAVPDHQASRLRRLSRLPVEGTALRSAGGTAGLTATASSTSAWPTVRRPDRRRSGVKAMLLTRQRSLGLSWHESP
jgi:hypothetical protein